jgi:hypothetical protein
MPPQLALNYSDIYTLCEDYASDAYPDDTLAVVMNQEYIQEILKYGKRLVGVFGRHKNGTLTICLLALEDGIDKVYSKHISGEAPGQQVWPLITVKDFKTLMPKPGSEK